MFRRSVYSLLCVAFLATGSLAGGLPSGSRPLTADEVRREFIGHTWSGPASGRPAVLSSAERKLYEAAKSKGSGQFREYYAPNGTISGRVSRSDFVARLEGSWRISGNEVCSSYRTQRTWKATGLKATATGRWCYTFVYQGRTLLMAASRTPPGRSGEIGQYFRPRLSPGNSASP